MSDWISEMAYSLAVGCIASVSLVVALAFGLAYLLPLIAKEQPEPEQAAEDDGDPFAEYDVLEEAEQFLQELHKKQEEEKS